MVAHGLDERVRTRKRSRGRGADLDELVEICLKRTFGVVEMDFYGAFHRTTFEQTLNGDHALLDATLPEGEHLRSDRLSADDQLMTRGHHAIEP